MTAWSKWTAAKPAAIALVIGLVAGPLISNAIGWQVTSGTARAELHDRLVAVFCEARARAEVPTAAKLDWEARYALAGKWAVMPGSAPADPDVTSACSRKLAA